MTLFRDAALTTYYYGTLPVRALTQRQLAAKQRCPGCVLFYHRVANEHPNPWTISRSDFERHMRWLLERYEFVSLDELQQRMQDGCSPRPTVSVTFDDGYADNCQFAIPFLLEHGIPVTYFVSLKFVQAQAAFPHDLERGLALKPNTVTELQAMAAAGVEIGAHTRNHADLGQVDDPERLFDEVVVARDELQQLVHAPVRHFAFPFGLPQNLNDDAIALARAAGFHSVCSAYGGYNHPGEDSFHIKRIHGDPEFCRLRNWITLDPRKLAR